MRCAALGFALIVTACGGSTPPAAAPPPPPAPAASEVAPDGTETFSPQSVADAIYAPLFDEAAEFRLEGNRHLVTTGDDAATLHYKVLVRCRVAEVVESEWGMASRIECLNFPEDSMAVNPLERVWVAGAKGLFRAEEIPSTEADWSHALQGQPVFDAQPRAFERKGECREQVADEYDRWCWRQACPGEPALEAKICFSPQGLVAVEAYSISDTTDVLALSVIAPSKGAPASTQPPASNATPEPPGNVDANSEPAANDTDSDATQ